MGDVLTGRSGSAPACRMEPSRLPAVSISVHYQTITDSRQLDDCCEQLAKAEVIAFDTEFVSEDTYRPELCLVQVAAAGQLYVIDSLSVPDLRPFWECLAEPGHVT